MSAPPSHSVSRGLSIRVLAPLILAAPVVVVSLVLGALAVAQSRRAGDDLAGQIVDQIDARVTARIADLARTAERVSAQNANLIEIGVFDPDSLRAWLPTMRRQFAIFDELNGIAWGDQAGNATWIASYPGEASLEYAIKDDQTGGLVEQYALAPDGTIGAEPLRRLEYDPRERPWYRTGVGALGSERGAAWSPVYSWMREDGSGATLGISYSRAIADAAGRIIGVLDTELELQSLSRFLSTLKIAETGFALIIDRNGGLVGASIGRDVVSPEGAQIPATDVPDQEVRAAARFALAELGPGSQRRRSVACIEYGGPRAWVGASLVDTLGLDWIAVTFIPEADLLARVQEARTRAHVAGAAAVGATLLAGVGVAWLAVRPIVRLRNHVRKVGEGDLEREVRLAGARELADLSRDINAMTRGLLDRARLQESLRLAMEVQQALLPDAPPKVPHLDVAGFSKYCDETGGDYYDFLTITEAGSDRVGIALGDVMGHGIAAALLMASARAVLRSRAGDSPGPLSRHLAHVNTQLAADTGGMRFMTMLLMTVDGTKRLLEWSTAGQHCGLLYDPASDEFASLEGAGLPLGILADATFDDHVREGIAPGSILLLTTDGLFEAHNPERQAYGWPRIQDSLRAGRDLSAEGIAQALYADLRAYCRETPPEDDVTFIVVRFTGA